VVGSKPGSSRFHFFSEPERLPISSFICCLLFYLKYFDILIFYIFILLIYILFVLFCSLVASWYVVKQPESVEFGEMNQGSM
jgi:hypothetical protein